MIPDFTMKRKTKNARETKALAKQILKNHPNHKIWLLYGDLGAGKTTFVKGLGRALGHLPTKTKKFVCFPGFWGRKKFVFETAAAAPSAPGIPKLKTPPSF